MALQEICDVFDLTSDSRSNDTPATSGMTMEDQFVHFGPRTRRDFFSGSNSVSPLNFYIPVAEYLEESPIQFGQISPSLSPISIPTAHIISPQDSILPSLFCPTVAPPSPYSPSVPLPFPMSHGTTTLAFLFQGGVIAAADTRSSCSGLVACPASQKILPVHSHLVGTTSGTSADCALWKRILARELRLYQLRYGRRLSTGGAAKLLAHMLHPFKGTELCVAATLCGWDGGEVEGCTECHRDQVEDLMEDHGQTEGGGTRDLQSPSEPLGVSLYPPVAWRKIQCLSTSVRGQRCSGGGRQGFSGPSLYYVCSDGTRLQGELFSVGSGSPYAYSVLDGEVRWGLSVEQAVSVAREAVYRATHRDAYSGNCVDLYHVTAKGWSRRRREELKEEYYREKERERDKVKERKERQEGTQDGDSENDKEGTGVSIAKVTSLLQQ